VYSVRATGRNREDFGRNAPRPEPREDHVGSGRAQQRDDVFIVELGPSEHQSAGLRGEPAHATHAGRIELPDARDVWREAVSREHRRAEGKAEIERAHRAWYTAPP